LPAAGGTDELAFALAFYSPDHPRYEQRLVAPGLAQAPAASDLAEGWAALCRGEDEACVAAIETVAARAPRAVESDFTFELSWFGWRGAKQRFVAIMVPPAAEQGGPGHAVSEDLSAVRRNRESN
jgi:hypothetical protein